MEAHSQTNSNNEPRPSTSAQPDLDWSQVRETVSMLSLAVAQIESSLSDGSQSITELTELFSHVAEHANTITKTGLNLMEKNQQEQREQQEELNTVLENSAAITGKIHSAICAFQFYDRINQRLDHVSIGLDKLGDLLGSHEVYDPTAWQSFQENLKSTYSMDCERIMFEHIMRGDTVQEALEIYHHHFAENDQSNSEDEIELF